HQADADEDRDEETEQRRRRQAEVLDDLDVLPRRELTNQDRRADEQEGEEDEIVEDAVAHGLAEHGDGHAACGVHFLPEGLCPSDSPTRPLARRFAGSLRSRASLAAARSDLAPSPTSATRRTNTSSSVSRTGVSDTSAAPAAVSSRSSSSGRPSGAS